LRVELENPTIDSLSQPAKSDGELILIVDDTPANLDLLTRTLEPCGYRILAAPTSQIALSVAARARPDLVLLDVMLPDGDGYETCRSLRADPTLRETPVLFISARCETGSMVEAFRAGGIDYITKPIDPDEVLIRVETHLRASRLGRQLRQKNLELTLAVEQLREEMSRRQKAETALKAADDQLSNISAQDAQRWGIDTFIGNSKTINKIVHEVRRMQNFNTVNVLITGESGTGKELVARAIHFGSARSKGPFVPVNCVAIPSELAESMFFGHTRGAFTGAAMDRKGFFELAHGGTLFLDEIGDMPAALQAKLLRVLEDGRVTPLGSSKERQVDVRIVAATNADLQSQIELRLFRQDLYFRLAQFPVHLPPLRQRTEDIPLIARHFLRLFATEMGVATPEIDAAAIKLLLQHPFPGNVRELKNVIERAMIESGGQCVQSHHIYLGNALPIRAAAAAPEDSSMAADLPLNLEAAENLLIKRALTETAGNIAEAARRLGINRTRIYRKLGEQGSFSLASPENPQ
jgi:DNA-binding NtrC family response regulator